jgi:hypothetical protein
LHNASCSLRNAATIWRSFNRRHSERLAYIAKRGPGCSLWPQAVLREIASTRVGARGPAVVDSSPGYRGFAGSCPRACRVGALSIAYCGVEWELPWVGLRCKDSTKALHSGLRTGSIQENIRTSSCRWDRNSIVTLARVN